MESARTKHSEKRMFGLGIYTSLMVDVASSQDAEKAAREMRQAIANLRREFAVLLELQSKIESGTEKNQTAPAEALDSSVE